MGLASRYYDYYDYYYDYESPWNREVLLDYNYYENTNLFFAQVAFDCLLLLALISFSIWCCTLRNAISPLRVTIATLTIWMSSQIILVVMDILWCAVVVVKEYYVVGLILEVIFLEIAYVLVFVTFFTIVHRLFDNLTDSGRPYTALKAFNWAIVAIVTIITIADLGLWTAEMVKNVDSDLTWALIKHQYKLTTARDIIYFIAALEILACAIFIAVKGKSRFPSKTPIHSLIAGAVSWFGYCIMFAIIEIRYYLNQSPYEYLYSYNIPDYQNFVVSLFQFFFVIGVFTGILLCIMQWHKVEEVKDFHTSVSAVPQPYATGPVQYPPHIQQQQHYQQQQYQQPYQQQQYQQQQYQTQQHQP